MVRLRALHRGLGLACLLIWLLQLGSGVALVFQRELAHWPLPARDAAFDPVAFVAGAEALAAARGTAVAEAVAHDGEDGLFVLRFADGRMAPLRVDGRGAPVAATPLFDDAVGDTLLRLHRQFWLGPAGAWLVLLSGGVLLGQIGLGLRLAWRRPRPRRPPLWRRWHGAGARVLGVLALLPLLAGLLLAVQGVWPGAALAPRVVPPAVAGAAGPLSASVALARASAIYPEARVIGLLWPAPGWPYYRVLLRQPDEPRQAHGATRLQFATVDGRLLEVEDPLRADLPARAAALLLPLHSGQLGGLPLRVAVLLLGLWLLAMALSGWLLALRRPRAPTPETPPCTVATPSSPC